MERLRIVLRLFNHLAYMCMASTYQLSPTCPPYPDFPLPEEKVLFVINRAPAI